MKFNLKPVHVLSVCLLLGIYLGITNLTQKHQAINPVTTNVEDTKINQLDSNKSSVTYDGFSTLTICPKADKGDCEERFISDHRLNLMLRCVSLTNAKSRMAIEARGKVCSAYINYGDQSSKNKSVDESLIYFGSKSQKPNQVMESPKINHTPSGITITDLQNSINGLCPDATKSCEETRNNLWNQANHHMYSRTMSTINKSSYKKEFEKSKSNFRKNSHIPYFDKINSTKRLSDF